MCGFVGGDWKREKLGPPSPKVRAGCERFAQLDLMASTLFLARDGRDLPGGGVPLRTDENWGA